MRLFLFASILGTGLTSGNPVDAAPEQPSDVRVVSPSQFDISPPLHLIEEGSASPHSTQVIVPARSRPEDKVEHAQPKRYGALAESATAKARGVTNIAVNFDGMRVTDNFGGLAPASPYIGVSDQYVVQTVNLLLAVYDRTGSLLFGPVSNDFIFNGFGGDCETDNTGYPLVLYDEDADRWLVSHVAWSSGFSGAHCIAVSRTNDPRGSWYRYRFEISNTAVNDWPMMGAGSNAYYAGYNMFSQFSNYQGAIAAAFERDAMIAGNPGAQLILFGPDPDRYSLMPMDIDGGFPASGVPGYFAEINPFSSGTLIRVYEMNVDWDAGNSTFDQIAALSPTPFDPDLCFAVREECIPQPNGQALTAISDRIMPRLQFREFTNHHSMVFNHTIDADGAGRAGVRWYELRDQAKNGNWSIYQQGTHAPPDGLFRWMGSIAMDASGNIALGYTASSSTQAPSIRYAARTASGPLGQLDVPEEMIFTGTSQGGTARWGDYSAMVTDANSFWFTHEYGATTGSSFNWATRIARITFDSLPDLAIQIGNGVGFAGIGQSLQYTITVENLSDVDAQDATVSFALPTTLDAAGATWNCTPSGSAACSANGAGDLIDIVDIPGSGSLVYQLSTSVLGGVGESIQAVAEIAVGSGQTDPVVANNRDTDTDPITDLFADGFEGE